MGVGGAGLLQGDLDAAGGLHRVLVVGLAVDLGLGSAAPHDDGLVGSAAGDVDAEDVRVVAGFELADGGRAGNGQPDQGVFGLLGELAEDLGSPHRGAFAVHPACVG